ncbi:hypothetical protein [Microbispora sp. H13382]|uniref:hypothetical protein n=1 Tax=Microbispora sp. H13382 TaxID=2729112 RepID=UPI0015FF6E3E|nr:hypothetical protein [Microbispora sp. H13382]
MNPSAPPGEIRTDPLPRDARRRFLRLRGRRLDRPGPAARLLTTAVSAVVHAVTAAILAGGVLIVAGWKGNVIGWLCGSVPIAIAIWTRPRTVRLPDGAEEVTRAEAPALFEAAGRIAGAVGAAPPAAIYVHDRLFRCAHLRPGLRRRPVLLVGLPLLLTLTPRERAGMLGAELARDVSGDPGRGLLVPSALATTGEWRHALTGVRVDRYRDFGDPLLDANSAVQGGRMASQAIGKVTGWVLAWPLFLAELALRRLVSAQSQHAVYYADQVAARAVSSRAVAEYVDALTTAESRLTPVMAAARRGETAEEIRRAVLSRDATPDLVVARRQDSLAEQDGWQAEPPTALRAVLLESAGVDDGTVGLGPGESDRIDAELSRHLARTVRELSRIT